MKKIVLAIIALSTFTSAPAQKDKKEIKYKVIFYKDVVKETDDLTITVDNAIANETETKFKLKITNKTNDFILYKPEESKFVINGNEMKPVEKTLVIKPNESNYRVINMKGVSFNTIKNYSFELDGLYRVATNSSVITAPDMNLPPSQNNFTAGDFSGTLVKFSKETDKTDVKFKVVYSGNKVGFIFPAKVSVKMPDGKSYANANSTAKPILLKKGDDDAFVLSWERMPGGKLNDMQLVEMIIQWNNAFSESTPEKMKGESFQLEFDEVMSNEKGR